MDNSTLCAFSIVLLAAVVHASFQLSVSVLTLMSGHALGRKTAHRRLLNMLGGFILGAAIMTVLLVSFASYVLGVLLPYSTPYLLWVVSCGAAVGVGISVWLFYYRDAVGTTLWIPRDFAKFLGDRAKSSKSTHESFGLGLTSVVSELLFIFAPLLIASLILIRLAPEWQLLAIFAYTGVSLLPLLIVGLLIGSGHKLSKIQRWRESNRQFLQIAAGGGLLILGAYVFVQQVVGVGTVVVGGY